MLGNVYFCALQWTYRRVSCWQRSTNSSSPSRTLSASWRRTPGSFLWESRPRRGCSHLPRPTMHRRRRSTTTWTGPDAEGRARWPGSPPRSRQVLLPSVQTASARLSASLTTVYSAFSTLISEALALDRSANTYTVHDYIIYCNASNALWKRGRENCSP